MKTRNPLAGDQTGLKQRAHWGRKHMHRIGPAKAATKAAKHAKACSEQRTRISRKISKQMSDYFRGLRDNPPY